VPETPGACYLHKAWNRTPIPKLFVATLQGFGILSEPQGSGGIVQTPAEYRAEAEMYVQQAERAETDIRRHRFFEMAHACLRLAGLAELLSVEPLTTNGHSGAQTKGQSGPVYTGL
jgi:hypothetical protein